MTLRLLPLIGLACTLPWLGSCGLPSPACQDAVPDANTRRISDEIHKTINAYRKSHGRRALTRLEGMDAIALDHCRYLLDNRGTSYLHGRNVTHFGSSWRAVACGKQFQMKEYGENVAAICSHPSNPAKHMLLMWETSFPHNQMMLERWTHTGICVLADPKDGALFVTQIFGKR